MSATEPRDLVDGAIDSAIDDLLQGNPRVTGPTVRRLARERGRFAFARWFAVAATTLLALGFWFAGERSHEPTPRIVTSTPAPLVTAPAPAPGETEKRPAVSRAEPRRTFARSEPNSEPQDGFPRLVIAPIEALSPLSADAIRPDALVLTGIQIPPLSVPSIADDSGFHE